MRKLFLLISTLISISVFGQFPNIQSISNANTLLQVPANGGFRAGIINRTFTDTTAANATYLDYYAGAQIFTTNDTVMWYRNVSASKWIPILSTAGGGGGGGGIYPYLTQMAWGLFGNNIITTAIPYFGTTNRFPINIKTFDTVRLILDTFGLTRSSSAANKFITFDTVTKKMYYGDAGTGSTPGIDDVLAVGQNLTQNRNINNGGYNLTFYSATDKKAARIDSLQRVQAEWLTGITDTASDFEIILLPDIQNMTTNWGGTINPSLGQTAGRAEFQWLADNITSKNIKAIISLGDLTNNGISPELDTADAWFDLLDPSNVVYIPTIGNHDYNNNAPLTRNASNYLTWFGPSRIGGKSWYAGNYSPAPESYFTKFDLMGRKFGAISLEFFPRQAVLNWADSVLTANEDRTFFYVTHGYLDSYGERSTDTSYGAVNGVYGTVSDARGDSQWVKLVKKHKNIAFTFNGHFINTYNGDRGFTRKFTDVGDYGNVVNQFFVNYQMDTSGGNGWLARFQFHPKENRIDVKYYSPYLDRYDQRVESFTYQFPAIAVQSSLAVQGTLSVKNEARFDSTVTFEKLEKYNIPFIGENGGIRDTALFRMDNDSVKVISDYFQTTKSLADSDSSGNVPSTKFVKKNFIQNQFSVGKASNFWINGKGVVTESGSGLYRSALQSGGTATMYVAQGSGYGLSIQRASNAGGYPQLTFFKDNTADFSTLATGSAGTIGGGINWQTVAPDNSTISTFSRIWDYKEGGVGTVNYTGLKFSTSGGTAGQLSSGMYLSGDGTLVLGGACYLSGTCTAPTNAWLDMQSTTRGFLPPRLTTAQMNAISSPGTGLMVWNTDSLGLCSYDGTAWRRDGHNVGSLSNLTIGTTTIANSVSGSVLYDSSGILSRNDEFYWDRTNKRLGIGTSTPAKIFHTVGTVRHASLGTASSDTTTNKPLGIDSNGDVIPMTYWPAGGGSGSPSGNFGNIQLNRNGAFATPASDSLDFESATGLSVKGNINSTNKIAQAGADGDITSWMNSNSGSLASTTNSNPGMLVYNGGAGSLYGHYLGYLSSTYGLVSITATAGNFYWGRGGGNQQSNLTRSMTLNSSDQLSVGGGIYVGSATTTPTAKLHVVGTTEQLRLGYDGSNYFSTTVGSSGGVTLDAVGSGSRFTFSDGITLPAGASTATVGSPLKFTTGTNLSTAEAGAMEYTTPQLFFTNGAAVRQELFQGQQNFVQTQFDKTSSTTLGDVTNLSVNVAAGKAYRFEAILYTSSNVAGGVKAAISGTATATTIIYEGLTTDAGLTTQSRATSLGTAVGAVTAVTAGYIKITGTIIVNAAGTLTVQFAQNASNGSASSVLVGSTFHIIEMAYFP